MWGLEHEVHGSPASGLLDPFVARTRRREQIYDEPADGDIFARVVEGDLTRIHLSGRWALALAWAFGGERILATGSRAHVDRFARKVALLGPPGGPDVASGMLWRRIGDDPTEHLSVAGGELRLMPLRDGRGLLAFVRHDFTTQVLAVGDPEQLRATALDRLAGRRGGTLRVRLGDDDVELHGCAAAFVVGYVDLPLGGAALTHAGGDTFSLVTRAGDREVCLRSFTFDELRRGDLGPVPVWVGEAAAPAVDTRATSAAARVAGANVDAIARPLARTRKLSAEDLELLSCHLKQPEPCVGLGQRVLPLVAEGLRLLAENGSDNLLLYACHICARMRGVNIRVHCSIKTLTRALVRIAERSPLVVRVGRRWRLRFGDLHLIASDLLREIAALTPRDDTMTSENPKLASPPPATAVDPPGSTSTSPSTASTARPGAPASSSPTSTRTIVAGTHHEAATQRTAAAPANAAAGTARVGGISSASPAALDRTIGPPVQPVPSPNPVQAEIASLRQWEPPITVTLSGRPILRRTLASVPDEESASRFPGRPKPRGPPK
jgi:hypothetical protein